MGGTLDFSSIATVSELAAAGERMVCLLFPEGLGALYCHSFLLSFYSPVLRNVLEDTPQQEQLFTIPLSGDSDVSLWNLALGMIYHQDTATTITLDNAQALLLLAHKYDMRYITCECAPPPLTHKQQGRPFVREEQSRYRQAQSVAG